jgi:rSAM/selenodomain-associated transferase 1
MRGTRKDNCVVFFVKYPEKGRVKTRLSVDLGEDVAVALYRYFTADLLHTLKRVNAQTCIYFYPESAKDKFIGWLGPDYPYMPQQGKDLGERMENAFVGILEQGFKKAIIIGSDSPDLPYELINEAFSALQNNDAVIGPTFDGGYYLLGFKRETFLPKVFHGMRWSTNTVYNGTLSILREYDYSIQVLSKWRDVDTLDDLRDCMSRNKDTSFRRSKTMVYIMKYKERFM